METRQRDTRLMRKGWCFRGPNARAGQRFPQSKRLGHMNNHEEQRAACAEPLPLLDEATPPLCPAPMPSQTIAFWTPRVALTATTRVLVELFRPQRAVQPA